jgi:hypothetical protein
MPNISDFDLPNYATAKALAAQARATAANYAAIPGQLDIIRQTAAGGSVLGQMVTDLSLGRTYRVDAQPAYGTTGTTANYTLTPVPQTGDFPIQLFDQTALTTYAGSSTSASVQFGPTAGLWVRNDTAVVNSVTVFAGVAPRRWQRADGNNLRASQVFNSRTITLLSSAVQPIDTDLTDATGASIVANQLEWNTLQTAWSTGELDITGRGKIALYIDIVKSNLSDAVMKGYGTTVTQSKANTRLITVSTGTNIAFEGLHLIGNGTEWDGTSIKTGPRGVYFTAATRATVRDSLLERFAYAPIYYLNTGPTRTEGNIIVGIGEYDLTTNPRGITNFVNPGYMPDGTTLKTPSQSDGNYSFGTLLSPGPTNPNHFFNRNLITQVGTGIDTGVDIVRLGIIDNIFDGIVGQHGCYIAGGRQLVYALNRTNNYMLDGIKNQLQTGQTVDAYANVYIGNSTLNGRAGSWAINLSVVSGTFRHIASAVIGNSLGESAGGGVTTRSADDVTVGLNISRNMGSYGFYALDATGQYVSNYSNGAGFTGAFFGVKTGGRLTVRGQYVTNYATDITTPGLTAQQRSGVTAVGTGVIRFAGLYVDTTTGNPVASIEAEGPTTILEFDGTNVAPDTLPVIVLGSIAEINGDQLGPIYSNVAATVLYNFNDAVVRKGKGPGRDFNASAAPTTGTYRVRDRVWNNNPLAGGTVGWVCTVSGTPGTWKPFGQIDSTPIIKTAAYTLLLGDEIILADATTAAFTVTLPTAISNAGRKLTVKKTDASANAVTIATTLSQTIDGVSTYVISTRNMSITVVSDGSNWQVI